MLGVLPLREAPVMSVVTPATGLPAPITGEPDCGCRLVVELYCGLALMELASCETAVCHAERVA